MLGSCFTRHLRVNMKKRHLRLTIAHLAALVAVAAIALALLVGVHRIRERQAFYLREARRYAQLEQSELNESSICVKIASIAWRRAKVLEEEIADIKQSGASAEDHFSVSSGTHNLARVQAQYDSSIEHAARYLRNSRSAQTKAKEYAELKDRYNVAGNSIWPPLIRSPSKSPR
jgi:succinate dehydrogenase/fumarate reductase flavoprotein subunit